jgi:uncharacterized cupredoxin-like copper-binding protein
LGFLVFAILALGLGSTQAQAASCSSFAVIKSYDAAAKTVEIAHEKGNLGKFFPRPEGDSQSGSRIAKSCKSKVKKTTTFPVKPTGGRMTVTQVRSNFEGDMLNDTEDPAWLPAQLEKLIAEEATVVVVIRPGMGKDAPLGITTIYLPITEEELAEIQRQEEEGEDL